MTKPINEDSEDYRNGYREGLRGRSLSTIGWPTREYKAGHQHGMDERAERLREENGLRFASLIAKLQELGIDPHELRDYLARLD